MRQLNGLIKTSSARMAWAAGLIILALAGDVRAQAPGWSVNTNEFQYTMSVVAFLHVDGELLIGTNDKVGAFVGGQLRGVASPIYVASADRYLAYLTIFANTNGEQISFRLYESATGSVVEVETSLTFEIDGQYGDVFQAFSVANPALGTGAEITNFYFTDADSVSTAINPGAVDIVLEYDQPLTALTPAFEVSDGAKVFIDRSPQESGSHTYDFSQPIVYTILSADESLRSTYEIQVANRQSTSDYFSCTNIITPNHDGANDTWIVEDVFKYKTFEFRIMDANGRVIFESIGYDNSWDGTVRASLVARGKYYFVISDPQTKTTYRGDILVLY